MAARTYSRAAATAKISTTASAGGEQQTATEVTTATEDKAAPASAAPGGPGIRRDGARVGG